MIETAPAVLVTFNAVFRRLRDAAWSDPTVESAEELSQAVTSCRRVLKAIADRVYPPTTQESATGNKLDDQRYRNRIREFIKSVSQSKPMGDVYQKMVEGLYDRFVALDGLANKGVHASVALNDAELCAIQTYIMAGELLRLARRPLETDS